jgi:hypothetical protein
VQGHLPILYVRKFWRVKWAARNDSMNRPGAFAWIVQLKPVSEQLCHETALTDIFSAS